jgi:hypothetical protein
MERCGGANIIPLPCGLSWLECNDADGVTALFTWAFVSDGEAYIMRCCSRGVRVVPVCISVSNVLHGYLIAS